MSIEVGSTEAPTFQTLASQSILVTSEVSRSDGKMKLNEVLSLVHKNIIFWSLHLLTIPPGGQRV